MDVVSKKLTRKELSQFLPTTRAIVAFENAQDDITAQGDVLTGTSFVVLEADGQLGSDRVLTGSDSISITDEGAGEPVVLDLTDVGTAGSFGSETQTVQISVDDKGRVTLVAAFDLDTDNIAEGIANLFFTITRARNAISGTAPISYNAGTGAISLSASGVAAGTYAPPTSITVDAFGRITAIA